MGKTKCQSENGRVPGLWELPVVVKVTGSVTSGAPKEGHQTVPGFGKRATRTFETGGADGPQTFALHHRPALVPKRPRRVRGSAEPHLFRFQSCIPEQVQRVRGHCYCKKKVSVLYGQAVLGFGKGPIRTGGVVRETSADVAVHHLEPLPHVDHHGRGRGVPCGVIAALA